MTFDSTDIASVVGVAGLLAGGVIYLIKVESTLSRIDSTLDTLSKLFDEFRIEHSQIWTAHTALKDEHHKLENRVGITETKLAMTPRSNQKQSST